MSIPSANPQTFGWIKSALNQSMLQATDAVSEIGGSNNLDPLETVSRNLHQIHGSLRMVELEAASIFAEDLESLADLLSRPGSFEMQDQGLSILKTGLERLKHYLNAIENQTPLSPLVLVDDINLARELTGRSKLSHYDLFDPPLEIDSAVSSSNTLAFPDDKRRNVLFHLRKRFRQVLVAWLNDRDRDHALDVMKDLMSHFQRVGGPGVLQQLWWVAAGFVESIKRGDISPDPEVKARFAELDLEMSRMKDERLAEIASSPPDELIRHMLYYIGMIPVSSDTGDKGAAERTEEIRQLLRLDQWFSYDEAIIKSDQDSDLVDAVLALSEIITKSDISHLESTIDRYFSSELDSDDISDFHADLDQLKETVDAGNVGILMDLVNAFCDAATSVNTDADMLLESGADIKIASALLMFGDSLENPQSISPQWRESVAFRIKELERLVRQDYSKGNGNENRQQALAELATARTAVVVEVNTLLSDVESFVSEFGSEEVGLESLAPVRRYLSESARLLEFIGADKVAELIRQSGQSLSEYLESGKPYTDSVRERFAYIFASIGVCVEMQSRDNIQQPDDIMARARGMIEDIQDIEEDSPSESSGGMDFELVAETIDENLALPTGEIIEDLESVIEGIGSGGRETVLGQLDQIDEVRKNIDLQDDDSSDLLQLSLLFNSIEDAEAGDIRDETRRLASIGAALVTKVVYEEINYDSEIEDFIGRLNRQIREIETVQEPKEVIDISDWEQKFNTLSSEQAEPESVESTEDEAVTAGEPAESVHHLNLVDLELRQVFITELKQHAANLQEAAREVSSLPTGEDYSQETLMERCMDVSRVVHTLTGNFNNMGLDACGTCLEALESQVIIQTSDPEVLGDYSDALGSLAGSLESIANEIEENNTLSSSTIVELAEFTGRFRDIQSAITRSAVPLSLDPEPEESDLETDFSISEPADELEVEQPSEPEPEPVDDLEVDPADEPEPEPADELEAEPTDELEAEPADELEVDPVDKPEPEPADELEAEPADELEYETAYHSISGSDASENARKAHGETVEKIEPDQSKEASAVTVSDFDEEIRQIFLEESESLLNRVNALLTRWRTAGYNDEILGGIKREFHTLKGSAAASGYDDVSNLSHSIESLLERETGEVGGDGSAMLNLLEEMHDGLASNLGFIPGGDEDHIRSLISMVELLLASDALVPGQDTPDADELRDGLSDVPDSIQTGLVEPTYSDSDASVFGDTEDGFSAQLVEEAESVESTGDIFSHQHESSLEPAFTSQDESSDLQANDSQIMDGSTNDGEENLTDEIATEESQQNLDTDVKDGNQSESEAGADTVDAISSDESLLAGARSADPAAEEGGIPVGDPGIGTMRIENRKLSDLLNYSGELGLTRAQLRTTLDGTRDELGILRDSMKKIRDGLRDLEFEADAQMRSLPEGQGLNPEDESFDPLQLDRYSRLQARAREVNQQLDELGRIERQLSDRTSEIGGTLVQQFHLGEQLQDGLISARMVSVNEYLPRFRQLVRETARRAGKSVSFSAEGGDVEVDRQVLDAMIAPFEHMIRNAVVHGIENSENRVQQGKPENGQIVLEVSQQGSELLIEFTDDGQGLDRGRLGARAIEMGLAENLDAVTDEQLLQVIAEPGFSTAEEVTLESGRGVGMDVVFQAVRSLGGSMGLSSRPGEGTKFRFRLPVTMTISQALLVRVGAYRFAIRTRTIERVLRVRNEEIQVVDGYDHVEVGDELLPIVNLAERLGEPSLSTEETYRSIVLVRISGKLAAFEVDQFEETVEIVTKTPGSQLTSIAGITGVTVLADTSIVLILNPGEYLDRESPTANPVQPRDTAAPENVRNPDILDMDVSEMLENVLVVDDSLVVRKVMQRDLEGMGLSVTMAVDGQNAIELLESRNVDVALVDLEMPRMNGYELLVKLRQDDRYVNLPIVVVTSRSGEIHRARATSLGADAYVTKPYDVQELEKILISVVREKTTIH